MKKIYLITLSVLCLAGVSCKKQGLVDAPLQQPLQTKAGEIVLNVADGFEANVQTKATAITAVPATLYWGASTGSAGSETQKWAPASVSTSEGKINTGKYQPSTPVLYNFYVSNQSFTIAAAKTTMTVANNSTDVLSGRVTSSSTTPSVALGHVFARAKMGAKTDGTGSGTISNISYTIKSSGAVSGTAGVYNMTTGSWESASSSLAATGINSDSDFYLIPGDYTITATYTVTNGENVQTLTKSATVTLDQGKVNTIKCTLPRVSIDPITISVTVTAWGSVEKGITLS